MYDIGDNLVCWEGIGIRRAERGIFKPHLYLDNCLDYLGEVNFFVNLFPTNTMKKKNKGAFKIISL